eukprot:231265-Rhodomonas_salina.1
MVSSWLGQLMRARKREVGGGGGGGGKEGRGGEGGGGKGGARTRQRMSAPYRLKFGLRAREDGHMRTLVPPNAPSVLGSGARATRQRG